MPQDKEKKESIWDSFTRAFRAGSAAKKNPSGGVKGLQSFAKRESERKEKPKEMKDSRWFKSKKADVELPVSTKPSEKLLHKMVKTEHTKKK